MLVKTTALLEPNAEMGDVQEAIHTAQIAGTPPAEGCEADGSSRPNPRHVEILVSQMGPGRRMRAMARNVMLRVELPSDLGRCGTATSVKTDVSCSSQ